MVDDEVLAKGAESDLVQVEGSGYPLDSLYCFAYSTEHLHHVRSSS